jgi:hypothetical protein
MPQTVPNGGPIAALTPADEDVDSRKAHLFHDPGRSIG